MSFSAIPIGLCRRQDRSHPQHRLAQHRLTGALVPVFRQSGAFGASGRPKGNAKSISVRNCSRCVSFFFIASRGPGKAACLGIRTGPRWRCSRPSDHAGKGQVSQSPPDMKAAVSDQNQRPRPYQPPPPSKTTMRTMMRIVVKSMNFSPVGALSATVAHDEQSISQDRHSIEHYGVERSAALTWISDQGREDVDRAGAGFRRPPEPDQTRARSAA